MVNHGAAVAEMIYTDATVRRWNDLILKVSERVSQDFPNVDPQDLFTALCGALGGLESLLWEMEPDDCGVYEFLRDHAERAAWNIRKEQLSFTSQYFYRVPDVAEILETVFDRCDWPAGYTPTDAFCFKTDRMSRLEVRMDALDGYMTLPEGLREALISRYHDKIIPEKGSTEERQLRYAVRTLTEAMNSYYIRSTRE